MPTIATHRCCGSRTRPDDVLVEVEKQLAKAIALNTRFADAYAWLGQVRATLGTGDGVSLIRRAITLEPRIRPIASAPPRCCCARAKR